VSGKKERRAWKSIEICRNPYTAFKNLHTAGSESYLGSSCLRKEWALGSNSFETPSHLKNYYQIDLLVVYLFLAFGTADSLHG
jgi:hypothetical protein